MKWLRVLACLFAFCVDVHVKAEEIIANCWERKIPCPIKASSRRLVLNAKEWRVSMAPSSLIERRAQSLVQLVEGQFYIEIARPIKFQTPYARVWCAEECKGIFVREGMSFTAKSLEGTWRIQRTGEAQVYVLPAGLQVVIGEVTDDGQSLMDFPQSLPWSPTVKEWSALYPGTLTELKPTLVKFRFVWKEAVEAVSDMHKHAADRAIAANDKILAAERAVRNAREREDQSLRELFRQKNP